MRNSISLVLVLHVATTSGSHWNLLGGSSQIVSGCKWLGSPPFQSHSGHLEGEQPFLGDLLTMVINHLLTGMILQVPSGKLRWQMENDPNLKMYSLLKVGIFQPAMLVDLRLFDAWKK